MNRYVQSANLLFWFALELSRPTIAFSLAERLESAAQLGALLSFQSFLPLLLALPVGLAGDRLGPHKLLPFGAFLLLGSGAAYGLSEWLVLDDGPYVALVLAAQLLNGLAWLLVWISVQALTAVAGRPGESANATSKRVNLLALTSSLGALAGPAAAGVLYPRGGGGWIWILFLAIAMTVFALGLLIYRQVVGGNLQLLQSGGARASRVAAENGSFEQAGSDGKTTWSKLGGSLYLFVLLGSLVLFFGSEFRSTFLPAYLTQQNVSTGQIGLVLTIGAIGVGAVRLLISLNLLKLKPKTAVASSLLMSVAGVALLPALQSEGVAALAFVSLLLAMAVGIGEPVLIAAILRGAHPLKRGLALAGRLTANRAAMLLAPLCASLAIQLAGPTAGIVALGGAMAALGLVAAALFWREEAHSHLVRREAR